MARTPVREDEEEDVVIIDSHVHLSMKVGAGPLVKACDEIGIDKVCLLLHYPHLKYAMSEAPDRVLPVVYYNLDLDSPSFIHVLADRGVKGLKIIRPRHPYDDERYFPTYERAQEDELPILFHTGIVAGTQPVSCDHMRPIRLDHIARTFPKLKIHGAHLGNPWYEEASMSMRYRENLWFDLSGSTLKKKTPEFIRSLLWWDRPGHPYKAGGDKHPYEKILFGTDVAPEWMADTWNDYQRLLDAMEVPEEYRRKILGENAAEVYGVET